MPETLANHPSISYFQKFRKGGFDPFHPLKCESVRNKCDISLLNCDGRFGRNPSRLLNRTQGQAADDEKSVECYAATSKWENISCHASSGSAYKPILSTRWLGWDKRRQPSFSSKTNVSIPAPLEKRTHSPRVWRVDVNAVAARDWARRQERRNRDSIFVKSWESWPVQSKKINCQGSFQLSASTERWLWRWTGVGLRRNSSDALLLLSFNEYHFLSEYSDLHKWQCICHFYSFFPFPVTHSHSVRLLWGWIWIFTASISWS